MRKKLGFLTFSLLGLFGGILFQNCGQFSSSVNPDEVLGDADGPVLSQPQISEDQVAVGDMILPRNKVILPTLNSAGLVQAPEDQLVGDQRIESQGVQDVIRKVWPGGIVPYRFHKSVRSSQREIFLKICNEVGFFANIRCVPARKKHREKLIIHSFGKKHDNGEWWGWVDRIGYTPLRNVNLYVRHDVWTYRGAHRTAIHELLHALGVSHEQNHPERGDFAQIHWENMKENCIGQYSLIPAVRLGKSTAFDFKSIMLYGGRSCRKEEGLTTMSKKVNGATVDYNLQMSLRDHRLLVKMYGGNWPSSSDYEQKYANLVYRFTITGSADYKKRNYLFASQQILSARLLSGNENCDSTYGDGYGHNGREFFIQNGCSGEFEIKYKGHSSIYTDGIVDINSGLLGP